MDGTLIGGKHRHQLLELGRLDLAQLGHPLLALLTRSLIDTARCGLRHGCKDCAGIAGQTKTDIPILANRRITLVNLHQSCFPGNTFAVAHAEIERRPHNQDDIRILKSITASSIEVMRIALRQQTAAGAIHISRNIQRTHKFDRLLMPSGGPYLLPQQYRWTLGFDEQFSKLFNIGRIAYGVHRGAIGSGLRHHRFLDGHFGIQNIPGNLQIRGSISAGKTLTGSHRDHVGDAFGRKHSRSKLGDRGHHIDVGKILQ